MDEELLGTLLRNISFEKFFFPGISDTECVREHFKKVGERVLTMKQESKERREFLRQEM